MGSINSQSISVKKRALNFRTNPLGIKHVFLIFLLINLVACAGVGPHTVTRDRFDYVTAISESWKKQTLLNLVKTRYADAPVFMDVTSVISQYAVESQLQLGASWASQPSTNSQNLGASAKYTDRPTITYSPLTGAKFTKSMMTPIPVPAILFLIQSGYPVDYVLRICVHTINGVENRYGGSLARRQADYQFSELLTSMAKVQQAGGLGMRVMPSQGNHTFVMFFRPQTDPAIAAELSKVKTILGLSQDAREFKVSYGSFSEDNHEIAILSRSMLQVMIDFASYIDVPESDIAEGRVYASRSDISATAASLPPLVNIHSGKSEPEESFVAVQYRDDYFWIDDRDYPSKRVFTFLMLLFSLTETGGQGTAPIVTVPTN